MDHPPAGPTTDPEPDRVVLRPAAGRAVGWALVGVVATAFAVYAVGPGREDWAIVLVVLAACVTAVPLLQLVAPSMWTLEVTRDGVRGKVLGTRVEAAFAGLDRVELSRRLGESRLVLRGPTGRDSVYLPWGADLDALRALLPLVDTRPTPAP